jgi:RNA:NAD 2'-phosphotransferase (TPT1/KptA family)
MIAFMTSGLHAIVRTVFDSSWLIQAVAADGKQRFGLKEESRKLYIRANQGHSIKVSICFW